MAEMTLAQKSVIGSMLRAPGLVGDVITELQPGDFSELGREIFKAIRDLYLDGEKIDAVLVLDRTVGDKKRIRSVLLDALDNTPTASNWREYMAVVKRETRDRRIQSIGLSLASSAMTGEDARPLVAELNTLLMDRQGVECLGMEQALLNFYDEYEHKPEYFSWGLDFLDEGLTAESGDFVILGGYPSDGKTALALSMAYEQAKTKRVGFFSLETKNSKLFNRIFSSVAKVSGKRIKRRELDSEDFYRMEQKADEIKHRNLYLIKASSMTAADIQTYTRARQFDVVYIDYLTLILDDGRGSVEKATNISKSLHRMAQDNDVMVVALSQLSRPEDKSKPKPPTLASLRDSGQIEQDADIVMFIYREEPGLLRSRRILRVAKNKEGETGQIPLLFNGDIQTFTQDMSGFFKKNRAEPEPKQVAFYDLPGSVKVPWEDEYEHVGEEPKNKQKG